MKILEHNTNNYIYIQNTKIQYNQFNFSVNKKIMYVNNKNNYNKIIISSFVN